MYVRQSKVGRDTYGAYVVLLPAADGHDDLAPATASGGIPINAQHGQSEQCRAGYPLTQPKPRRNIAEQ